MPETWQHDSTETLSHGPQTRKRNRRAAITQNRKTAIIRNRRATIRRKLPSRNFPASWLSASPTGTSLTRPHPAPPADDGRRPHSKRPPAPGTDGRTPYGAQPGTTTRASLATNNLREIRLGARTCVQVLPAQAAHRAQGLIGGLTDGPAHQRMINVFHIL